MAGTQKGKRTQSFRGYKSLPRLRTPPAIPTGPRMYRPPRFHGYRGGPGEPPPGFVIGQTSKTEWMVYWAMSKIFGEPADPRVGPFIGAIGVWGYQVGGRQRGQSVIDFVVYPQKKSRGLRYGFRVQTEYFHNFADAETQAYDLMQLERLSEYNVVVDLYDYEFVEDITGQATIILIKRGLNGELFSPPSANSQVVQRVRPSRRIA